MLKAENQNYIPAAVSPLTDLIEIRFSNIGDK
jgi:hypothetical protein